MEKLITVIAISFFTVSPADIGMLGLKIGDASTALDKLKLEVVAKEEQMVKYKTQNENDFSVTHENGKIVYMENDWLQDPKQNVPLFSDFRFGVTSLKDIREKFRTNGFVYKNTGSIKTDTDVIMFNCFEFDSRNNEILVLITKVPLNTKATTENIASFLKLDAIIIADKDYLDSIWGTEKSFDPNYKKVYGK